MELYSLNYGDLYKSNYGYPSIELCSSKNQITEIHKSNYGDPELEKMDLHQLNYGDPELNYRDL